MKQKKRIPFEFVIDYLNSKNPVVKPMFGCFGIYINEKIVLVLRDRKDHPSANGVWLATSKEHHESLRKEFPSMHSIKIFGKGETNWQIIPAKADDFESSAIRACELILQGDARIGKIPKAKSKKIK